MEAENAIQIVDLTKLYWAVGIVVVTNLGAVGSVLWIMGRALWWVSKLDSRVAQNSKDIHSAHKNIRDLRRVIYDGVSE